MPKKGNLKKGGEKTPSHAASSSSKPSTSNQGWFITYLSLFLNPCFLMLMVFLGKSSAGKGKADPQLVHVSDEDSQHDTASIISSASENKSVLDEGLFK